MHYMMASAAMQMDAAIKLRSDTVLGASIVIAVVAATAALWLAFNTREAGLGNKVAAAFVMGAAIGGMHYTGHRPRPSSRRRPGAR